VFKASTGKDHSFGGFRLFLVEITVATTSIPGISEPEEICGKTAIEKQLN